MYDKVFFPSQHIKAVGRIKIAEYDSYHIKLSYYRQRAFDDRHVVGFTFISTLVRLAPLHVRHRIVRLPFSSRPVKNASWSQLETHQPPCSCKGQLSPTVLMLLLSRVANFVLFREDNESPAPPPVQKGTKSDKKMHRKKKSGMMHFRHEKHI